MGELKLNMLKRSENAKEKLIRTMFYREIHPDKITDYLPTFFHVPKTGGSSFKVLIDKGIKHKTLNLKINLLKHTPAKILRDVIGDKSFDSLYKFAFVRNPYERCVSAMGFVGIVKSRHNEFLKFLVDNPVDWQSEYNFQLSCVLFTQTHFLFDDGGNLLMDYVARYENYHDEHKNLGEILGVNMPNPIKRKCNASDWKDVLNDESIKIINKIYKQDFINFNYEML